jgi:hypothetical protein
MFAELRKTFARDGIGVVLPVLAIAWGLYRLQRLVDERTTRLEELTAEAAEIEAAIKRHPAGSADPADEDVDPLGRGDAPEPESAAVPS